MLVKYKKELAGLDDSIATLEILIVKPFEKDTELQQMKSEHARLEKEISQKIKENMAKQADVEIVPDLEIETEEVEQQQAIER